MFLPASVRVTLEALPPTDRLAIETHLDNVAALASDSAQPGPFLARFEEVNGRRVSDVGAFRVSFTLDPYTHVLFVHRIEQRPG